MKKIQIIKNNSDRAEKYPLINIVTRTAGRPNFFDNNYNSIKNQVYKNYKHWVIYDDSQTYYDYLKDYHDIELVKVNKDEVKSRDDIVNQNTGGRFFYNLYFNDAFKKIKDGWILILDDDDSLAHPQVLSKVASLLKFKSDMLIFQMEYLNGNKLPRHNQFYKTPMLGSIGSPCVIIHSKFSKTHKWDGWKCADYRYINSMWKKTARKVWLKEALVNIGSINGNFGKKNDKKKTVNSKEKLDLIFTIPTYDRHSYLKKLLSKLDNVSSEIKYKVFVIDDHSKNQKAVSDTVNSYEHMIFHGNKVNNGKTKYWMTFNTMLNFAKKYKFNHLIQIDDDFHLCENFVEKIYDLSKKNQNKFIRYIKTNRKKIRWNTSNWVDGGSMIPYSFLRNINFEISQIPMSRWRYNKKLSSGVWQQITQKLNKLGYKVIHLDQSLVKHLGYCDSKMNPEERKKNNINEINFIDGKKK